MTTIMIVDDAPFMRAHLTQLLVQHGYNVIQAEDGQQAVALYRQARPAAVLMDIAMPRKNGLEALSEILAFDPRAQVIVLTALDQPLAALKALQYGAKDFLSKSASSRSIIDALQRALRTLQPG